MPLPDLLARLVAFDTTSQRSNLDLVDFLTGLLERAGATVERLPSEDGAKANLWARVGPPCDPATRAGLVLCGHTDVVPALEDGWESDPFTLTDQGDRWTARGACDMKGFLALAIERALHLDPARLAAPLYLLFTYDEEVGSEGARRLAAAWPTEHPLPRSVVVGEPTSLRAVWMHKGHLRLRVTTRGEAAHSAYPRRGTSAVEPAARIVTALADLRRQLASERPPHGESFPEAPFTVLNVGTVRGGAALNVIPDHCEIGLGIRLLPGQDGAGLIELVRERVTSAVGPRGWELEVLGVSPPLLPAAGASLDHRLRELLGQREPEAASFSSDAGIFQDLGLDCVLFGPGAIEVAHRANEYVFKEELDRAGRVLDRLIESSCRRLPAEATP